MKTVFVAFISQKTKKEFEGLEKGKFEDKKLYEFILRAIDDLKQNPMCGTKIHKTLWPKDYIKNYNITNLWKYDLPNAWRLIYTIETNDVKIMNFILEWFDHKNYDKKFKY
jgi:Txe/YoeB family toxin of Txe-Axe toxin-antitoxin module